MRLWPWSSRKKTPPTAPRVVMVRARFDSAQTTADNRRHWANADHLSADAAANAEVRRILRSRARYEVANNSYARGIVLTLANDLVVLHALICGYSRFSLIRASAAVNRQSTPFCCSFL